MDEISLRRIERSVAFARRVLPCAIKMTLIPTMTRPAAVDAGLRNLTYPYDMRDSDDIMALHRAFHQLPKPSRFLVLETDAKIAIWIKP